MKKNIGRYLSPDDIENIYAAELEILSDLGIRVEHESALDLLEDAGAIVDRDSRVVRMKSDLVETCLSKIPRQVTLAGRDPDQDCLLTTHQEAFYTRTQTGSEMYADPETNVVRQATMTDLKKWMRLQDALNYDIATVIYPDPQDQDVPLGIRDVLVVKTAFESSVKPVIIGPYDGNSLKYMIELCLALRGSKQALRKRPPLSILIASISPLILPENQVEMILMGCEYGIPLELFQMPMAGMSAPATIAGVLTVSGAELLAMNVIAQLARPHSAVIFAPRTGYLNMSLGVYAVGLEYGIISAAQVQMAHEKYGLPADVFGPHSTSAVNDSQAAIESLFGSIFASFAGASIIGGAGSLEGGRTVDPVQALIADEILKMEAKATLGFEVNADTLGLEALREVGIGKDFLSSAHTLKHFRNEFYHCPLFDMRIRPEWEKQGAKDMQERAREKAVLLMNEHHPEPLDADIEKEMDKIIRHAGSCEAA